MPAIILFGIAMLATFVHLIITRRSEVPYVIEIALSYIIFFSIGVMGILAFYYHTIASDETAASIGWPTGNPFQSEIAVANLGFGVIGLMAIYYRQLFWVATVIGSSIFLLGAFVVHLFEFFRGNTAPYNIGIFIWVNDLLIPIILLTLLWQYMTANNFFLKR